jgi:hypothetical protein
MVAIVQEDTSHDSDSYSDMIVSERERTWLGAPMLSLAETCTTGALARMMGARYSFPSLVGWYRRVNSVSSLPARRHKYKER